MIWATAERTYWPQTIICLRIRSPRIRVWSYSEILFSSQDEDLFTKKVQMIHLGQSEAGRREDGVSLFFSFFPSNAFLLPSVKCVSTSWIFPWKSSHLLLITFPTTWFGPGFLIEGVWGSLIEFSSYILPKELQCYHHQPHKWRIVIYTYMCILSAYYWLLIKGK